MNPWLNIWRGLDWSVLLDMLRGVIPALLCITVHETCHGLAAWRLGDDTAKRAGRLTLNPLKHIDIMGLLMMVVFRFGWAKPVPVNMYRLRHPKRDMALVALAGPASNLLLAVLTLFLYGALYRSLSRSGVGREALYLLGNIAYLSTALAVFNIIPIPPLDGSKILFALIPDRAYARLMRYERYGMILLLVLVATRKLGAPLTTATGWVFDRLFFVAEWGFELMKRFV